MNIVTARVRNQIWNPDWFSRRVLLSIPSLVWVLVAPFWFAYIYTTEGVPIGPDAGKYLVSGALSANGHITYKYLFAPKPPGSHLVTTTLHLLFDGRYLIYLLTVGMMVLVVAVIAWLVTQFVYEYTGSELAAVTAPLVLLTQEAFATAWMHGWMGKYVVVALALGAFLLVKRGHPLLGVGVATLAPAFWQFAAIIPLVTVAAGLRQYSDQRDRLRYLASAVLLMAALTGAVIAPYLLAGAGSQLLAQTVVVPLLQNSSSGGLMVYFWLSFIATWEISLPVFALGATGLALLGFDGHARDDDTATGLVAVAGWFIAISGLTGQTGPLDVLPMVPFVAIGVGMVVGVAPRAPLSSVRQTLPNVGIQTTVLAVLGVWAILAFIRFGWYPPYVMAGEQIGLQYLAGYSPATCHGADNFIGYWMTESGLHGSASRTCSTLAELLGRV